MASLLAVDLGVRTGLAVYGRDGRLRSYRSQNFGNAARLKRDVPRILGELPDLTWIVLEGGGPLAEVWQFEAARRVIQVKRIAAEEWRGRLLYPRQHRDAAHAKRSADELARRVIRWSGAPGPTSLRHDAAEAILLGLWAVLEVGWLDGLPSKLRP